jgi:hypothetical protein
MLLLQRSLLCTAVLLIGLFLGSSLAAKPSTSLVVVDTTKPHTGNLHAEKMKDIFFSGISPCQNPPKKIEMKLRRDGMRRLRLINYEHFCDIKPAPGGGYEFVPFPRLHNKLLQCKEMGYDLHLIIGQFPPPSLAIQGEKGRLWGPSDWDLYDIYIEKFLEYVTLEMGFKDTVWEIGNEWGQAKANWLTPKKPKQRLDPAAWPPLEKLYGHISRVFQKFESKHPELKIALGGLSVGIDTIDMKGDRDYFGNFVRSVIKNKWKCDFVSTHPYGVSHDGTYFIKNWRRLQQEMRKHGRMIPLWVTEWGAFSFFRDPNVTAAPQGGAFFLDFLHLCAREGIDEALYLMMVTFREVGGLREALFNQDSTPTHRYKAFEMLKDFPKDPLTLQGVKKGVDGIAARDTKSLSLLLWNMDWEAGALRINGKASYAATKALELRLRSKKPKGLRVKGVVYNGSPWKKSKVDALNAGLKRDKDGISLKIKDFPYGSYCRIDFATR